jgi:hypothetical protein
MRLAVCWLGRGKLAAGVFTSHASQELSYGCNQTVSINRRSGMKRFRPTIKLGFSLVAVCALLLMSPVRPPVQGTANAGALTSAFGPKVNIQIDFGRPRFNCTGFGICKVINEGSVATVRSKRILKGALSLDNNGKLELSVAGKPPDEGPTLFIDDDIPLSPEIARSLSSRSTTIARGEYAFSGGKALLNAKVAK